MSNDNILGIIRETQSLISLLPLEHTHNAQLKSLNKLFQDDVLWALESNFIDNNQAYRILGICSAFKSLMKGEQDLHRSSLEIFPTQGPDMVPFFRKFDEHRKARPDYPTVNRNLVYILLRDTNSQKYCMLEWEGGFGVSSLSGGVDGNEDRDLAAMREAQEESGYKDIHKIQQIGSEFHLHYYHPTKFLNFYSVARSYVYETDMKNNQNISVDEANKHNTKRLSADEIRHFPNTEPTILYFLDTLEGKAHHEEFIAQYNDYNPRP